MKVEMLEDKMEVRREPVAWEGKIDVFWMGLRLRECFQEILHVDTMIRVATENDH
jgi:hypothetical protein